MHYTNNRRIRSMVHDYIVNNNTRLLQSFLEHRVVDGTTGLSVFEHWISKKEYSSYVELVEYIVRSANLWGAGHYGNPLRFP